MHENRFKFRIGFSLFHDGQIVSERTKARLKFEMVQFARPVLIKMPKKVPNQNWKKTDSATLLERLVKFLQLLFRHASRVSSLNLLFQVMLHSHSQLIELIPLLSQTQNCVFRISKIARHESSLYHNTGEDVTYILVI